jgi:hypothetical protein
MRHAFVLAIVWLLVGTCSASPQDKAAPLPQDSFLGEWVGDNKEGIGLLLTRFVVSNKDKDWSIKAWVNLGGGPKVMEAELPKVKLSLLRDGYAALTESRPYGVATWDFKGEGGKGGWTIHLMLRSEKEKLVVETFMIDPGIETRNIRTLEKFKKK